jgi:hypothetical protein
MKTQSIAWLITLAFAGALIATGTGCTASSADDAADPTEVDTDTSESAVRTRNCPASFTLTVSDMSPTPIPAHAGTASQRAALVAIQSEFMSAGTLTIKGVIDTRKDGVCTYKDPATNRPFPRIKLYSKGGKDILQLGVDVDSQQFTDHHRVYAFPSSYSESGFTFANDTVLLDGVVGIPDGPNLVVKVGTGTIAAAQ